MNPAYPVYIISKGRWDSRLTSKALEHLKVPYKIVIEPQEFEQYASVIDSKKILKLPFSNLGQGGIPARNWVWEHSVKQGAKRHWIMDDNISAFYRLNKNLRVRVNSGTIFKLAEDFTDRYTNVAISGLQYRFFAADRSKTLPAFSLNARVYSCLLIKNDIKHRWRGRYNEDTDLCLRVLKDGLCTILFYAFLQGKSASMHMSGGNTDELYAEDGRLKMAKSLEQQHPDVAKTTWKYDRWHHVVDYTPFKKNKLIRRADLKLKNKVNNHGMVLIKKEKVQNGSCNS